MLGAIYIGISGMDAYEQGLQTISNNVANLNTAGFKSTTVNFSDLFSFGGGVSFSNGNSSELAGRGVSFGTPLIDFTQGDLRQSQNDLDLAIQGSGFLVLLDGNQTYYARTGQFGLDRDGFVVAQGTTHQLAVLDGNGRPVALNIDARRTSVPMATTKIAFAGNLSSGGTDATVPDVAVYDDAGGKHVWTVKFTKSTSDPPGAPADPSTSSWTVTVTDADGSTVGTGTLKFDGSMVDPGTQQLVIDSSPEGATPLAVTLDFSGDVTSYSAGTTSTLRTASVDGYGQGTLTTVAVDEDGQIKLTYSNDQTTLAGAVALADFHDPQDLQHVGDGLYRDLGSGPTQLVASGTNGLGKIEGKVLEASNVNLSDEFGQLILIQRGYQASSQVVSVANDMIQQLFGIRGQG